MVRDLAVRLMLPAFVVLAICLFARNLNIYAWTVILTGLCVLLGVNQAEQEKDDDDSDDVPGSCGVEGCE